MSTPSGGGYIDPATGQYVPGEFNEQVNLPSAPGPDTAAARKAEARERKEKFEARQAKRTERSLDLQERALKKRLLDKHIGRKERTRIQSALLKNQAAQQVAEKEYKQSVTEAGKQHTKYLEASGQYEKLLTGTNRDAYAALKALFNGYGLGSLAGKIYEYAKQGFGADTISLLLQDTKEYKERFSGNEDRVKKGLPVLSPAEYLSVEASYRQIMQDAGLPKGFYDNPADFRKWIAGDVSPTELKGRVDIAVGNTLQANPNTVRALQQLYGIDQSYITAWALDQSRALPLLQKQAQAAQFGAEALKRNLSLDRQDLEDFVTAGLTLGQVSSGFQAVAEALPNIQAIAARFGDTFTQRELEKDLIEGGVTGNLQDSRYLSTNPTAKRKALASQERALFSGAGGATVGGLSGGYQPT